MNELICILATIALCVLTILVPVIIVLGSMLVTDAIDKFRWRLKWRKLLTQSKNRSQDV